MITPEVSSIAEALSQEPTEDLGPNIVNHVDEQAIIKEWVVSTTNDLTLKFFAGDGTKIQKISPASIGKPSSCPNDTINKIQNDPPTSKNAKENANPPLTSDNKFQYPIKINPKAYPSHFSKKEIDSFLKHKNYSSNYDSQFPPLPLNTCENFSKPPAANINTQIANHPSNIPPSDPVKLFIPQRDYNHQVSEDNTELSRSKRIFMGADLTDNNDKLPIPIMNCNLNPSEMDWGVSPGYQIFNKSSNIKSLVAIKKNIIETKREVFSKDAPLFKSRKVEDMGSGYCKITPRLELKPTEFEKNILYWMGNAICNHCRNDDSLLKYGITAEVREDNCLSIALSKEEWTHDEFFAVKRIEGIFNANLSNIGKINGKKLLVITINYEI